MTEIMTMTEERDVNGMEKAKEAICMAETAKAEETDHMTEETNVEPKTDMTEEEGALINEMRLCFLSRGENESLAKIAVAGFIACLDPTLDVLDDIRTAVSEAVTNAIIHGYQGTTDGIVYLSAFLYEDGVNSRLLRVDVEDTGTGIEDVKKSHGTVVFYVAGRRAGGDGLRVYGSVY